MSDFCTSPEVQTSSVFQPLCCLQDAGLEAESAAAAKQVEAILHSWKVLAHNPSACPFWLSFLQDAWLEAECAAAAKQVKAILCNQTFGYRNASVCPS
jgi:hypothetical protein